MNNVIDSLEGSSKNCLDPDQISVVFGERTPVLHDFIAQQEAVETLT